MLTDDALRNLLRTDPQAGWRAFIDQYTPLLVGLIRRAGVDDRDETMEVYILICERLSANGFERLKSQEAGRGSLGGWLSVVTRNAAVDWIRSRKGRRRLFHAIRDLAAFDQRVFELYYWDERTPSEIAEILALELKERSNLFRVLDALERIQTTLTDRHRAELVSLTFRSKPPVPLEESDAAETVADPGVDPETALRASQLSVRFENALGRLPAADAAIVRLKYGEGLTNADIELATGLTGVTAGRLQNILGRLRQRSRGSRRRRARSRARRSDLTGRPIVMHFTDIELQRWRESGPGADGERVVAHLAACAECARRYAAVLRSRPLRAEAAADAGTFIAAGHRVARPRASVPQRWVLSLAASLILVILIVLPVVRHRRESVPDLHFRGTDVVALAPQGAVDRDAVEFVWSSAIASPRFRIEMGDATHVIFATEATGSRLVMPRATRALLQPGVEYWWTATALDADAKPLTSSSRRTFTIRAR